MSDYCNGMNAVLWELAQELGCETMPTMSNVQKRIQLLKDTLADAIVRPAGVAPDAAYDFVDSDAMYRAQARYERDRGTRGSLRTVKDTNDP